jgi:hypothetical protein
VHKIFADLPLERASNTTQAFIRNNDHEDLLPRYSYLVDKLMVEAENLENMAKEIHFYPNFYQATTIYLLRKILFRVSLIIAPFLRVMDAV